MDEKATAILLFVEEYLKQHLMPPTIREILEGTGIASTSTVKIKLEDLDNQGEIEFSPHISRGIRLRNAVVLTDKDLKRLGIEDSIIKGLMSFHRGKL